MPAWLAPAGASDAAGGEPDLPRCRFTLSEFSGALGDLGTFLPLVLAMSIVCGMELGSILVLAGLACVVTGLWSAQPIPVQPMKAVAAVAITERLAAGEIAAAGLIVGALMLALALTGSVDWLCRAVPRTIVRGIQLGVGVKLVLTGLDWLMGWKAGAAGGLPLVGWDSLLVAAIVGGLLLLPALGRIPLLLLVFLGGFGLLHLAHPGLYAQVTLRVPRLVWTFPSGSEWLPGLVHGALPQLPLTLLNSVVAVCALSQDYFPGRGIAPKPTALSIGLMNLLSAPLGGAPVCHGAGGLAAQYRFGGRTGGGMVMIGLVKVAAGLLFGATLVSVLSAYPVSILAVMLVFAGVALGAIVRDVRGSADWLVVGLTAVLIVLVNTLTGFAIGALVAGLLAARRRLRRRASAAVTAPVQWESGTG